MKAMKLYVGGLSYDTTDQELQDHFAEIGEVTSATIIKDRNFNNRSKGFGFVEMASDDDAKKAIAEYDGKEFMGRNLTVNEARDKKDDGGFRPRSNGGYRGGNGGGYHDNGVRGNGGGSFRRRSF